MKPFVPTLLIAMVWPSGIVIGCDLIWFKKTFFSDLFYSPVQEMTTIEPPAKPKIQSEWKTFVKHSKPEKISNKKSTSFPWIFGESSSNRGVEPDEMKPKPNERTQTEEVE